MMFSFFIVQETLYLYDKKRSAEIAYAAEWNKTYPRIASGFVRACG